VSITRLQQARQMYAMGQRVAKTLDGSRPGYRGSDYGDEARGTGAYSGGNNNNNKGSDRPETTRPNPHTDSGYSKTSVATGDEMRSAARDFVQTLNHNNAIEAAKTGTKFSPYTGGASFAPTKNPFSLGNIAKNIFLGVVAPQLLAGTKLGPAINTFNQVNRVAGLFNKNIDVKDTISNLFSGNKTSTSTSKSKSKSTSKNNTTNNGGGDGEGLASLDNQASGYDEYILLLQKLQSGNISDGERNRFNVLKNMLGI